MSQMSSLLARRISITSRKPCVHTMAVRGRRRVIRAFVATVVPCENRTTLERSTPPVLEPLHHAVDRIRGRAGLGDPDDARVLIQDADIREGPADVDGHAQSWANSLSDEGLSSSQRHRHWPHRRAGGAAQLDAGAEEGEFVELVGRQLVELGHLKERHPSFGEQVGVHREEIQPGRGRRLLQA